MAIKAERNRNMAQITLTTAGLPEYIAAKAREVLYYDEHWLQLITSQYGYRFYPLTTREENGNITGFLPLLYIKSTFTGKRLVSLPFADFCPLLADNDASAHTLVDQAVALAQQLHVDYLELRTGEHAILNQRQDLAKADLYSRWTIELHPDPDFIWSRLPSAVRRKVKQAQRMGVQRRIATSRDDMLEYYRLHLATRSKKHGMPAQPLSFFLSLWDTFAPQDMLQLELADFEGQVIAASIMALRGKTAQYLYGASNEQFNHFAPNNLLYWEFISWCCLNDYTLLDQGRTAHDNPGLMQFKRHWAATEIPLPYYYYPTIRGLASTPETSPKYRLLTSNWRKLPLSISGPLGGRLYRHLG
jgi:FemAB-related protein (PEP-CTERM system-associated)